MSLLIGNAFPNPNQNPEAESDVRITHAIVPVDVRAGGGPLVITVSGQSSTVVTLPTR